MSGINQKGAGTSRTITSVICGLGQKDLIQVSKLTKVGRGTEEDCYLLCEGWTMTWIKEPSLRAQINSMWDLESLVFPKK